MKILVTGGCGFIGSHLVDSLVKNHEVLVVDDFSGASKTSNKDSHLVRDDYRSTFVLDKILEFEPEIVFHLAAQISVVGSVKDPLNDFDVNAMGSAEFFHSLSAISYVKRVIFVSSGGTVYGDSESVKNEFDVLDPRSPYGISKVFGEHALRFFCESSGKDWVVLRYGNVYGPRQSPKGEAGVISIFADAMLNNRSIQIFGNGGQTRDYVHVSDVIEANLLAMNLQSGIYNVSTGKSSAVNTLFRYLKESTGYSLEPKYMPARNELKNSYIDSTKLRKCGWGPRTLLPEGVITVLDWLRSTKGSVKL